MKYCKSEGECLSYIRTAVRRRYKDLVLKELHNQNKTVHTEWMEVQDTNDQLGEAEFYMDLEITLLGFRGKERKIAERMLLYGENDKELARYEGVSRQYCNKIRKKFIKKM